MRTTKRRLLIGSASTVVASTFARSAFAKLPLEAGADADADRKVLVRMIKIMFPHKRFPDGPYERTAEAVFKAAAKTPSDKLDFAVALQDMTRSGFAELDDTAALAKLKSIETTPFFKLVKGTTVVTLYDDPEVWAILGYEGPSFDKGGYINRGFNDLSWLPEPRIEEYREEAGQ